MPSFRLLTALEKLHSPAGNAYLCRENFTWIASTSFSKTTGSPDAPAGMKLAHWGQVVATRTLSRLSGAEFEKVIRKDASHQDWQLVPFPIKNRTTKCFDS